jgi:hypothetical protein
VIPKPSYDATSEDFKAFQPDPFVRQIHHHVLFKSLGFRVPAKADGFDSRRAQLEPLLSVRLAHLPEAEKPSGLVPANFGIRIVSGQKASIKGQNDRGDAQGLRGGDFR